MKKLILALTMLASFSTFAKTTVMENASLNYTDCYEQLGNQVYQLKPGMVLASVSGQVTLPTSTGTSTTTYTGYLMGANYEVMEAAGICGYEGDDPANAIQTTNLTLTLESKKDNLWEIVKIKKN